MSHMHPKNPMETYHGYVRSPSDAIKLFEACRIGLLPRVQRRLSEKERQLIRSGSVFVWDEKEAGMRRWTDGKSWSASRVSGSFLTYREMEGKRGGGFPNARRVAGKTPDSSGRASDEDQEEGEPDGYRYKADGLMKQSFSISTSTGQHLHLISYYSRPHPGAPELPVPSTDPMLRNITPAKGMYPESSLVDSQVPPMTRAPMQQPYMSQSPRGHAGAPHPYQPPYVQSGYPNWPISPATPPYNHYSAVPGPYPPAPHPAHPGHYPPHQQPPYGAPQPQSQAPQPPYDRPLPLPVTSAPPSQTRTTPPAHYGHHAPGQQLPSHMSQPRAIPEQQATTQPPLIDPRLSATSARNPQGPLPTLTATAPLTPATTTRSTPPPPPALRHPSASPPRSETNGTTATMATTNGNKASLSALLHPTPPEPRPADATVNNNNTSSSNSPRGSPGQVHHQAPPNSINGVVGINGGPQKQTLPPISSFRREDMRTINALDKKFLQT